MTWPGPSYHVAPAYVGINHICSAHTSAHKTKVGQVAAVTPRRGEGELEKEREEENSEGARVEVEGEEGGPGPPI